MRVLFVVRRGPEPVRGGGDLRTLALLRAVRGLGHEARTFAAADHGTGEPTGDWVRRPDGLPSDDEWPAAVRAALRAEVARVDPDVAVLGQVFTRPALDELAGRRVVLDAHNVEGALARALLALDAPNPIRRLAATRTAAAERAAAAAVDAVWACSAADAAAFADLAPTPVTVVPNAVAVPPLDPAPRRGHGLLYAGSLWYPPNRQAADTLLDLLPVLRERRPDATLTLAGHRPDGWPPPQPGLHVVGPRDSFAALYAAASVLAVPLRVGSGTRVKLLEAFAAGLPVVSTATGYAGLDVVPGEHLLRAETPAELAAAVHRVWDDPAAAAARAAAAHELVARRYGDAALSDIVAGALRSLGSPRD